MIPCVLATPSSNAARASAAEKPQSGGTTNRTGRCEGHCAHHRASATIALAGERVERGNFDDFRGERRSPVTQWPGHRHTAIVKARVRHNDGNPASTWSFDQGTLIVHHLGRTAPSRPLRYATYEFAAKAAAVYFAKHPAKKTHSALASSTAGVPS